MSADRYLARLVTAFLLLVCIAGCSGSGSTTPSDIIPPAATADLATSAVADTTLTLSWTVSGDDGTIGQASSYAIRYSTAPITAGNFAAARMCGNLPVPGIAGTTQTFQVAGLLTGITYYFALITADEARNWSTISNVVTATTTGIAPLAEVHYDGDNVTGVGRTGGGLLVVAARFTTTQLGIYAGNNLSSINVYNYLRVPTTFTVKVYGAGTASTPGAVLYSTDFTVQTGWNTLTIAPAITIPAGDLWVGYAVTHVAGEFPVGYDAGPPVTNGEWLSLDNGVTWFNSGLGNVNLRLVITP